MKKFLDLSTFVGGFFSLIQKWEVYHYPTKNKKALRYPHEVDGCEEAMDELKRLLERYRVSVYENVCKMPKAWACDITLYSYTHGGLSVPTTMQLYISWSTIFHIKW